MKVLVIYKKSTYELYSQSTDQSLLKYIASNSSDVKLMKESHEIQKASLMKVVELLDEQGCDYQLCYRANIPETDNFDLIIIVGGDGTTLDASHYIKDTPVLAINSDPDRSFGFFAGVKMNQLKSALKNLKDLEVNQLTRLEMMINDQQVGPLVLNDLLYSNTNPAATTRYETVMEGDLQSYKNSGALISTGAGSSAWMFQENGPLLPLDSKKILIHNRGTRGCTPFQIDELELISRTRQGMLYIDGPHIKIELGLGQKIKIKTGQPLTVLGQIKEKRKKDE